MYEKYKKFRVNLIKTYIFNVRIIYRYKGIKKRLYRKDVILRARLNNFYLKIKTKPFKFKDYLLRNLGSIFFLIIYFLIIYAGLVFKKGSPNVLWFLKTLDYFFLKLYYNIKKYLIIFFTDYVATMLIVHIYREFLDSKFYVKKLLILCLHKFYINNKTFKIIDYIYSYSLYYKIFYKILKFYSYTTVIIAAFIILDFFGFIEIKTMRDPDFYWLQMDLEFYDELVKLIDIIKS